MQGHQYFTCSCDEPRREDWNRTGYQGVVCCSEIDDMCSCSHRTSSYVVRRIAVRLKMRVRKPFSEVGMQDSFIPRILAVRVRSVFGSMAPCGNALLHLRRQLLEAIRGSRGVGGAGVLGGGLLRQSCPSSGLVANLYRTYLHLSIIRSDG